jgi:hypothetical protein
MHMHNLNSARFRLTLLAFMTFLFAASHDARADANTIAIDSVTIAANQLILQGPFGPGTATVVLASKSLSILASSPSQVVAALNPVPHIGTYTVILTVGNKTATTFVSVTAKTLEGIINFDGSVGSGTGFSATHVYAGHYRVTFPSGTFQIGSPYVFPPVLVTPLFSAPAPDVNYYVINGDQSGVFEVDFGGVDTAFSFNLTQIY